MQKYYKIYTYGCQMNVHESEKLAAVLSDKGYSSCDDDALCDVIVFNTCCIRENAESKVFGNVGALKNLKAKKPSLVIAVGGCMTQQNGISETFKASYPFVDIVFGTHNLERFGDILERYLSFGKKIYEIEKDAPACFDTIKPKRTSFPNAWINIMQGCDNFCTYCIVPYVRGRERSRSIEDIFAEASTAIESGYKEITLLGQNVNSYGKDLKGGENFAALINKLSAIDGDYRLRFMSNHPKDLTKELVAAVADNPHCCHQIHLPVQAGSDRILKLMNRRYTVEDYLEKVGMIKKVMPDCAITTDIMVGFPTETEEDFSETLALVEKVRYSQAFTFVYSRRKGTVADKMDGQIAESVKKDRIMRLVDKQNSIAKDIAEESVGKTLRVLCEDKDKRGYYMGRDEYGKMAYFTSEKNVIGEFLSVKISDSQGVSLFGDIVR